jgi:hypothetical protein
MRWHTRNIYSERCVQDTGFTVHVNKKAHNSSYWLAGWLAGCLLVAAGGSLARSLLATLGRVLRYEATWTCIQIQKSDKTYLGNSACLLTLYSQYT